MLNRSIAERLLWSRHDDLGLIDLRLCEVHIATELANRHLSEGQERKG